MWQALGVRAVHWLVDYLKHPAYLTPAHHPNNHTRNREAQLHEMHALDEWVLSAFCARTLGGVSHPHALAAKSWAAAHALEERGVVKVGRVPAQGTEGEGAEGAERGWQAGAAHKARSQNMPCLPKPPGHHATPPKPCALLTRAGPGLLSGRSSTHSHRRLHRRPQAR